MPKHKGITYFLIDLEQPGVDVRPLREMTGEAAFNEVFLSEARVPDANRLGGLGEGWRVAMTTLANERDPGNPGVATGGGSVIGRPDLRMTVAGYRRQQADQRWMPCRSPSAAGSPRCSTGWPTRSGVATTRSCANDVPRSPAPASPSAGRPSGRRPTRSPVSHRGPRSRP